MIIIHSEHQGCHMNENTWEWVWFQCDILKSQKLVLTVHATAVNVHLILTNPVDLNMNWVINFMTLGTERRYWRLLPGQRRMYQQQFLDDKAPKCIGAIRSLSHGWDKQADFQHQGSQQSWKFAHFLMNLVDNTNYASTTSWINFSKHSEQGMVSSGTIFADPHGQPEYRNLQAMTDRRAGQQRAVE